LQPSQSVVGLAHSFPSSIKRIPLSRTYSQTVAPDIESIFSTEDVAMAQKAIETDSKPTDILNGDIHEPAGQAETLLDPESDENVPLDAEELKEALGRPPPVNSSYLPLPWKGRLGYVSRDAQQLMLSL
jgi:UV DNA damage endonuclease